jgi:hypothetical protein
MSLGVQIDPVNGGEWAAAYTTGMNGAFAYAGFLYAVLTTPTAVEIFKSGDGVTWTIQDQAHEPGPVIQGAAAWFDGVHTVWVAVVTGPGETPIQVPSFNLATGLWVATLTPGPSVGQVYAIVERSDGSLAVINSQGGVTSGLGFSAYKLGAWTNIDLGANAALVSGYDPLLTQFFDPAVCTDGSNLFIFFFALSSAAGWTTDPVFFQLVTIGNTLGTFFTFPGQLSVAIPDMRADNGAPYGVPSYCGSGRLVLPIARNNPTYLPSQANYPTVYVSTDSGSTWTEATGTGMDPSVYLSGPSQDNCQFAPASWFEGTRLFCVYAQLRNFIFPSPSLRFCFTTPNFAANPNTWSWTDSTAAEIASYPGQTGFSFPSVNVIEGVVELSTDMLAGGNLTAWFLGSIMRADGGGQFFGTNVGFFTSGQQGGGSQS